jgi:hypothetical protein
VTTRPLLLLDVDGVLNPHAAPQPPPGYQVPDFFHDAILGLDREVLLNPEHGTWLRSLAGAYELMWATGWEHHANRLICPVLGLPELPVIEFPPTPDGWFQKLPSVRAAVGTRACAWIDDFHTPNHYAWARERGAPTLLIEIDPERGLQRDHVDQLREWGRPW